MKTNEPDKVIGRDVTRELLKKVQLDLGEVGQRPVLELVGTEAAVGEDEDVPMDRGPFELVEVGGLGPAHVRVQGSTGNTLLRNMSKWTFAICSYL